MVNYGTIVVDLVVFEIVSEKEFKFRKLNSISVDYYG
jgi:hypothetical protein